jgi:BirA family biotin operon repressor/biotin-[acetyl-CoA-carboxylase] ligase
LNIIKLNAIGSTNSYLKGESDKKYLKDFTVVLAKSQTEGRGQMGTKWRSESGKNLTCSVFKRNEGVSVEHHFYISIVCTLAIITTLEHLDIGQVNVKWPNDILAERKKICGVLIENVIKKNRLEASVIGIGLNVNQKKIYKPP